MSSFVLYGAGAVGGVIGGRLHLAGGPLAWLSSVPGVRDVATGLSGVAASASGAVAATGEGVEA